VQLITLAIGDGFKLADFDSARMTGNMLKESVEKVLGIWLKVISFGAMWFFVSAKAKAMNKAYTAGKGKIQKKN